MLASDCIDAVYIGLPNTMHREWALRAAAHGKHVFCEKPLATTVGDAIEMCHSCREAGVVFFEAFVFLYHPQSLRLREIMDAGRIGLVNHVQSRMCFYHPRPTDNIRMNPELGGGCIYDVGAYPITYSRWVFNADPIAVQATSRIDPEYGVDTRFSIVLSYPGDRSATIYVSFDESAGRGALITGGKGFIDVPQPFHPRGESSFAIVLGKSEERETTEYHVKPFTPAIEHFHDCVVNGATPRYSAENALGTLRAIEAALESAKTGERVRIDTGSGC
jgi:predicted dehydrogenase